MTYPQVGGIPAQQGEVTVPPGDVNRTCTACGTGASAGHDGDPRHVVVGGGFVTQTATLANGQQVPVQVPIDIAYHLDCHAAAGCDHCAENLAVHDGSVKGKADPTDGLPFVHDDHLDIEPGEYEQGEGGILRRTKTKAAARKERETAQKDAGYKVVDAKKAAEIHAKHAAGEPTGEAE